MTIGVLAEMAGLVGKIDEEELRTLLMSPAAAGVDELVELLRATALRFLAAGGVWSTGDWVRMSRAERVAAEAAGNVLYRTRAVAESRVSQDPAAAAAMLAPVDGGEAYEAEVMRRLHAAGMERAR